MQSDVLDSNFIICNDIVISTIFFLQMMAFDCGMEFVTLRDIENKSFAEQLHLIMANVSTTEMT